MDVLVSGLAMGESPRWHDGRLWLSDWGAREIVATDLDGNKDVVVRTPFGLPFCFDWLPYGPLLVVAGRDSRIMRREVDGTLVPHADLRFVSDQVWNEIVIDYRGNTYINGGPGIVALLTPAGAVRKVADGLAFPNGMAISPGGETLIVAESHGKRLTAFQITDDGSLARPWVWADLGDGVPDGICVDADGAVWYGDVPNKRCVRVREGGEVLQTIDLDRGCFACMLGGADRKTLFTARGLDVLLGYEVREVTGERHLEQVTVQNVRTDQQRIIDAGVLIVLIGAEPRTAWLPKDIALDDEGFVLTGPSLPAAL